jgi:hypothetical protein
MQQSALGQPSQGCLGCCLMIHHMWCILSAFVTTPHVVHSKGICHYTLHSSVPVTIPPCKDIYALLVSCAGRCHRVTMH